MRRSKLDVDRYISSVQSASPSLKEKPVKGFYFAKLYFDAKEYELAKRYVSDYLKVQERDPKAHRFLGLLYENEGSIDKAVGCYKRSVDLNPAQKDLVLKVAELLCSKPERDPRVDFWVERAAKLHPGSPAVYNLKEKLLSSLGQPGWNQLHDLLQSELQQRPGNAHINIKLVQLYCSDGRLEQAVGHCLAAEKKGALRASLDWYSTLVRTLQEYLAQPSVLANEKMHRKLQKELLLAQCNLLRLSLSEQSVQQCVEALQSFDCAMQTTAKLTAGTTDELSEAFVEMRGHLYQHAGTLLLKMAHDKEQQWRAVTDLAALCYLLAYQDMADVDAVALVVAAMCTETPQAKPKRLWVKPWLKRRGEHGLYALQQELEVEDRMGFRQLLRMTAEEFEVLLRQVAPLIRKRSTKMQHAISPEERLAVTLRCLATGETFSSFHFQYRIGETTVSKIVMETCEALHQTLKEEYLKTPTTMEEWLRIAEEFERKWQFPHCLGAIDGKHIAIQKPPHSGTTFWNYKQFFSIQMMAVVDATYQFRYVCVGVQGRASDSSIFGHSDLKGALDCGLLNIPPAKPLRGSTTSVPYVFVGDDGYPLRRDLIKPYPFRNMDHDQRVYNYRLSRARRIVENGFGILANRWRIFRTTILLSPEKVEKIVLAAVCLHNYLRVARSETYLPPAYCDWEDAEHRVVEGTWRLEGLGAMTALQPLPPQNCTMAAKDVRDALKQHFQTPTGLVPWQEKYI